MGHVCKTRQLHFDGDIADSNVRVSHGTSDHLAISVTNVHMLGWRDRTIRGTRIGIGRAKCAAALREGITRVVYAGKVLFNGPGVGAPSVEEEVQRESIPDNLDSI